jgi:hypothetical protein
MSLFAMAVEVGPPFDPRASCSLEFFSRARMIFLPFVAAFGEVVEGAMAF